MKHKHGFGRLVKLAEAQEILGNLMGETGTEEIPILEACGRVTAEDVIAEIDVPHFAKSAMDGYAVIVADTVGASQSSARQLDIISVVTAGVIPDKIITSGTAITITTGAPLPEGADGVLMVEYTEECEGKLTVYKTVAPGENIIRPGSDVKMGTTIIKAGTKLTPEKLGVLAAIGKTTVLVKKTPVIAYFSSGNEILELGQPLEPGKIHDINSVTICTAIKAMGCKSINLGLAIDSLDEIEGKIREGLKIADIVILSGGSSLGGEDFMVEAVKRIGEVLVHGISVKPGKPVLIGKVDGKAVLGLPGYPTSALSDFHFLVVPLINKMMGLVEPPQYVERILSRKIASTIGRYEFLAVKLSDEGAVPVMKGSSAITTLAEADGFIEIDEDTEVLDRGEMVQVRLF